MKNAVFWDVAPCTFCMNIPENGILHSHRCENLKSDFKDINLNLNSVVLVRKRTIPTERPQPAGEVSANFS
jgi:hypothetical protein